MFRKKCIYLDPATRTIRKCRPTSPAKIGFVFIFLIRIFMACFRYGFIFLMVFVAITYLQLTALRYERSCTEYCDSIALAKKVGKIATYVYMGIYILFNIPNYFIHFIEECLNMDAFPFTLMKSTYKLIEKKLKKIANIDKYYISGLYFFFPIPFLDLIGAGFLTVHGLIDVGVMAITKYHNDFDGFKCRIGLDDIIKKSIEIQDDIIKEYNTYLDYKDKSNNLVPLTFEEYITRLNDEFKKSKYIGSFKNDKTKKEFISELENIYNKYKTNYEDIKIDRFREFNTTTNNYIKEIFSSLLNRPKDFKNFLESIDGMSDLIKNILKNFFVTKKLDENYNKNEEIYFDELKERHKLFKSKIMDWFSVDSANNPKKYGFRKLYCFILYFINLFTGLVDSFGGVDEMKNEMKVSNVAGSACFFAWMVMASMIATGKMI